MNSFLPSVFIILTTATRLASQDWHWVQACGGPGADGQFSAKVAADDAGNAYLTGYFAGTAQFGPFGLNAAGESDIFLCKYSPSGQCLWAVKAGGTAADHGRAIALHSDGGVVVTGFIQGAATFGTLPLTSSGGGDIFVAKYDSATGACLWVRKGGGGNSSGTEESGYGIDCDAEGSIYATGVYSGSANFSGIGLTQGGPFIAKYDAAGTILWAAQATGSSLNASGWGIRADNVGGVLLAGTFFGTTTQFGDDLMVSLGNSEIFLARANAATGAWEWAVAVGAGGNTDLGRAVTVDAEGNVYLAGSYMGAGLFFGNPGIPSSPFGSSNSYLIKADSQGNHIWTRTIAQSGGSGSCHALAYSPLTNSIIMAGVFNGESAFCDSAIVSTNTPDAYVAAHDTDGNCLWAHAMVSAQPMAAYGVAVDGLANVMVAGYHSGPAFFDETQVPTAGLQDVYLAKLGSGYCPATFATASLSGCDSVQVNAQWYGQSGTYIQTLVNALGCDSLLTVDVTIEGLTDGCGVCLPGGEAHPDWNASCADCAGTPYGLAFMDTCGICTGGVTGLSPCTLPCQADLNGDGMIGYTDFADFLAQWGCAGTCTADFNGDGMVTFTDLGMLMTGFSGNCP